MIKLAFIPFVALAFQIIPTHWDFILGGIGLGALLVRNNILLMLGLGITFTTGLGAIVADHF